MDDETLEFVARSTYRQRVLRSLEYGVLMPKEIAERSGIKVNHVSKVLSELRSKDLIDVMPHIGFYAEKRNFRMFIHFTRVNLKHNVKIPL